MLSNPPHHHVSCHFNREPVKGSFDWHAPSIFEREPGCFLHVRGTSITRNVVVSHQKALICASMFHIPFSCFFQPSFQRSFLEGPSINLSSKVRFSSHLGFRWGPKMAHRIDIFWQKGFQKPSSKRARASWSRPGRDSAPETPQNDPRI